MLDSEEVQIATEYLELMNKLAVLNEKVEMTNIIEIKKQIKAEIKKVIGVWHSIQLNDQRSFTELYSLFRRLF
jgi:hypothetical protein